MTHKKTGKLFDRTQHPLLNMLDTAKIAFDVVSPRHALYWAQNDSIIDKKVLF